MQPVTTVGWSDMTAAESDLMERILAMPAGVDAFKDERGRWKVIITTMDIDSSSFTGLGVEREMALREACRKFQRHEATRG